MSGIVIDTKLVHPLKVLSGSVVTPLPTMTEVSLVHPLNTFVPKVVTVLGIVIEVKVVHPLNASAGIESRPAMKVTGLPRLAGQQKLATCPRGSQPTPSPANTAD